MTNTILYSVTVTVETAVADDWFTWMMGTHIPDVMATGYFHDFKVCQLLDPPPMKGALTYNIQYHCESMEKLEEYQKTAAPALKKDHQDRYGDRSVAFRTILKTIK